MSIQAILFASRGRVPIPFADTFGGSSVDTSLWTVTNSTDITVSEGSGHLSLTADASYSGSFNQAYIASIPRMNFTGCTLDVGMPNYASMLGMNGAFPSGGTTVAVFDGGNGNNLASLNVDQKTGNCTRSNNGANSAGTFNAGGTNADLFRIQHVSADNTWKFYTSYLGTPTLQFTSAAANWNPTSVGFYLLAYIYGTNQQGVVTQMNNLVSTATY